MDDKKFIAIDFGSKSIKVCREENGQLSFIRHLGKENIAHQAYVDKFGLRYFNHAMETTTELIVADYIQFFRSGDINNQVVHDIKMLDQIEDVYVENGKTYFRYVRDSVIKKANNHSFLVAFIRHLLKHVIKAPKVPYVLALPNDFDSDVRNTVYTIFKSLRLELANIYTMSECAEEYFINSVSDATETNIIVDLGYSDMTVSIVYKSHDTFKRRERRVFPQIGYKVLEKLIYKKIAPERLLGHRNEVDNFFFEHLLKEMHLLESKAEESEYIILENSLNYKRLQINYAEVKAAIDDYFLILETALKEIRSITKTKIGVSYLFLICNLKIKYFNQNLLKHLLCTEDHFSQTNSLAVAKGLHMYHTKLQMQGFFTLNDKLSIMRDLRMLSKIDFYSDMIKRLKSLVVSSTLNHSNSEVYESFVLLQSVSNDEKKALVLNDDDELESNYKELRKIVNESTHWLKINPYELMLPYFRLVKASIKNMEDLDIDRGLLESEGPSETRIFLDWIRLNEELYFQQNN